MTKIHGLVLGLGLAVSMTAAAATKDAKSSYKMSCFGQGDDQICALDVDGDETPKAVKKEGKNEKPAMEMKGSRVPVGALPVAPPMIGLNELSGNEMGADEQFTFDTVLGDATTIPSVKIDEKNFAYGQFEKFQKENDHVMGLFRAQPMESADGSFQNPITPKPELKAKKN